MAHPLVQRHERRPDPEDLRADPIPRAARRPWTVLPTTPFTGNGAPTPMIDAPTWARITEAMRAKMPAPPPGTNPDPRIARTDALAGAMQAVQPQDMPAEGGQDYTGVPAKVYGDGRIRFNWQYLDYFNADGTPDKVKIISTVIHECFHALSVDHTGFQGVEMLTADVGGVARTDVKQTADEAVTDMLALEVYSSVFNDQEYSTGYLLPATSGAMGEDRETLAKAKQGGLPGGWTGDLVSIIAQATGTAQAELTRMYFEDKGAFEQLLADDAVKQAITNAWQKHLDDELLATHGLATQAKADELLDQAFADVVPDDARAGEEEAKKQYAEDPATVLAIRTQLTALGLPAYKNAEVRRPEDLILTDATITERLKRFLGLDTAWINPMKEKDWRVDKPMQTQLKKRVDVLAEAQGGLAGLLALPVEARLAFIDGLDLDADIKGASMFIRREPSATPVNMRLGLEALLKINEGGDAEAQQGRTLDLEPNIARTPITQASIDTALKRLGAPHLLPKVVQMPTYHVNEMGRLATTKADTKLALYPQDCLYGLSATDLNGSMIDLVHEYKRTDGGAEAQQARAEEKTAKLSQSVEEFMAPFGGAAYDAKENLVLITSKMYSERAMLHELGHLVQEHFAPNRGTSFHEYNTETIVLEYHNFLTYENRYALDAKKRAAATGGTPTHEERIRVAYDNATAMAGDSLNRTWADLRQDLQRKNAAPSLRLMQEIEQLLQSKAYLPYADVIKGNLVAEYFKREEEKAQRAAQAGPPAPGNGPGPQGPGGPGQAGPAVVPQHVGPLHGHPTPLPGGPGNLPVIPNTGGKH
jgi:hypothetical protein